MKKRSQKASASVSESHNLFTFWIQLQRSRVDTETRACWVRTIGKDVSEMSTATRAVDFDSTHAMTCVFDGIDSVEVDGLIETRPTAARVILGFRLKQILSAGCAAVNSRCFFALVDSGKRSFSALLAKDSILFRRQFLAPFFFSFLDFLIHIHWIANREKGYTPPSPFSGI
jgi:hypothetical protein